MNVRRAALQKIDVNLFDKKMKITSLQIRPTEMNTERTVISPVTCLSASIVLLGVSAKGSEVLTVSSAVCACEQGTFTKN